MKYYTYTYYTYKTFRLFSFINVITIEKSCLQLYIKIVLETNRIKIKYCSQIVKL